MPVYDYQTALDHAELWMEGLDEEEVKRLYRALERMMRTLKQHTD